MVTVVARAWMMNQWVDHPNNMESVSLWFSQANQFYHGVFELFSFLCQRIYWMVKQKTVYIFRYNLNICFLCFVQYSVCDFKSDEKVIALGQFWKRWLYRIYCTCFNFDKLKSNWEMNCSKNSFVTTWETFSSNTNLDKQERQWIAVVHESTLWTIWRYE